MDLSPFKRDIDELILEFSEGELTTLSEMKRLWLSRKFTYIFEAVPSTNSALFMQSLYAQTIGYIVGTTSLSCRLGGLYCLYCLYETQPFKPPFRVYLSLGELKRLKDLVVDSKEKGIKVVRILVKSMLEKSMFLFGFVDINEGCVTERVSKLTDQQNTRVQIACEKLFDNTRLEKFLHMDLGMEVDLHGLKKMSSAYAEAKNMAIKEASAVVDVRNIEHISEEKQLIGDVVNNISEDWNAQKELFYQQTGLNHRPPQNHHQQGDREFDHEEFNRHSPEQHQQQKDDEEFDKELEQLLSV